MKKVILLLSFLFIVNFAYADIVGEALEIREEDGSPSIVPYQLKVSNGTLTDNGDGTGSLNTSGSGSVSDTAYGASWDGVTTIAPSKNAVYDKIEAASGDITSVGDVTTGAAFDGTQGNTLTFNNAGGDGLLLYNGEFSFDKNVGIGTTNPAYTLDVSGDIRATGDIYSADQYTVTGDMGALGNLGVGTTTPALKVDVRGAGTSIFGFVGGSMGIGNTAPQGLLDVSSTTPGTGLVVLSTGRVGIGLTNPSVALDVSGTVNATALTEGGNAVFNTTETPGGELGGSWGTPTVDATHSGSAHHSAVTVSGTPDYITLSGQDIVRAKLDISDDTNATGGVGIGLSANDFTFVSTELSALTWSAGGSAQFSWTYNLSGTDPKINFNNNSFNIETGNLGVGNTAPQALLDVGTSPGVGLIVLNTGNVGIGTTNPTNKFEVIGGTKTGDTIPIMRLVIKNIDNTFNKTGAVYSNQKNITITRMDTICPIGTSATSVIFTLKTVGTDGTGPLTNLSVGQTSALAKLTVTSFTGGTLPAGYGLLIDGIVQVGGTPPLYQLEVFGYEY